MANYDEQQNQGGIRRTLMLVGGVGLALGAAVLMARARRQRTLSERSREAALGAAKESFDIAKASVDRARGPMHGMQQWTRHRMRRIRNR